MRQKKQSSASLLERRDFLKLATLAANSIFSVLAADVVPRHAISPGVPFALPLRRRRFNGGDLRRVEIDVRLLGELHAELVAQHPRANFHDLALREVAEFERAE